MVALVASVFLSLSPSPAAAIETETFRLTPSPLVVQGFERRSFAFEPEAGETAGDAVRLTNTSDESRRFRIYGADARRDPDTGALAVDPAAAAPQGVGGWLEVSRGEITLAPGESDVVPFTLTRPDDRTAEGLGAVVAEEVVDGARAGGVELVYRLAILVRLDGDVAGLHVGEPRLDPPAELFPSRSEATVTLTNETLQPVAANVSFTSAGLTGRYWDLGEQQVRLGVGESIDVAASWTTVPRWGGYFEPAVSVAWEGGSIVRTGPRSLHPPLWLLALAILVIGIRATRELRGTRAARAADDGTGPDVLELEDAPEPELATPGNRA